MNLSSEQRCVVEAGDGHYLVVASAGSGKTRVLTERVRHLLMGAKVRSRILALTFTKKAAKEMRERLHAVPDLAERAYIGTIHSFCQSILEAHGRVLGFESLPTILEREADRMAMLETALTESPALRGHLKEYPDASAKRQFLYRLLEKISFWKRDWSLFQSLSSEDALSEVEGRAFREYQAHLASQGVIDFDDILLLALRILTERPAVADIYRRIYRYLCVDEGQDLNAVQYALIQTLGKEAKSILIVGDPHQAIYGFNGSSHRFMMEVFPQDFPVESIELRQNYRSSKAVIRVANALFPGSNEVDVAALEGEARIVACRDEKTEAEWIVGRIQELLKSGGHPEVEGRLTLERMVVLARNRFVFAPLQKCLGAAGIPFHLRQPSGGGLFESEAGRLLDLSLRHVINPRNELVLGELVRLLKGPEGLKAGASGGLDTLKKVFERAADSWRPWFEPVLSFAGTLLCDVNRFAPAMSELETAWRKAAAAGEGGEGAIGDLAFLRDCWANYIRLVPKDTRSLVQFRNQLSTGEILPHTTGEGLMLAPVHTVKGLEFEVVFLCGLAEGTFPDYRAIKSGGSALAEEKNDLFVAVTRAKRLLYMTWPRNKFMPWDEERRTSQQMSRYLRSMEPLDTEAFFSEVQLAVGEDPTPYQQEGHATSCPLPDAPSPLEPPPAP
jgi:DNA helicase-2/ATP-dependent DNA helicase PcrA